MSSQCKCSFALFLNLFSSADLVRVYVRFCPYILLLFGDLFFGSKLRLRLLDGEKECEEASSILIRMRINSAEYRRVLPSIAEYCRSLPSVAEHRREHPSRREYQIERSDRIRIKIGFPIEFICHRLPSSSSVSIFFGQPQHCGLHSLSDSVNRLLSYQVIVVSKKSKSVRFSAKVNGVS